MFSQEISPIFFCSSTPRLFCRRRRRVFARVSSLTWKRIWGFENLLQICTWFILEKKEMLLYFWPIWKRVCKVLRFLVSEAHISSPGHSATQFKFCLQKRKSTKIPPKIFKFTSHLFSPPRQSCMVSALFFCPWGENTLCFCSKMPLPFASP